MTGTAIALPERSGSGSGPWGVKALPADFTADSVDASFPTFPLDPGGGALASVGVVPDADSPPDTLSVQILDVDGIDLLGGSGAIVTTARRLPVSPPEVFTPGLTLVLGGNTLVGAKARIVPYFL